MNEAGQNRETSTAKTIRLDKRASKWIVVLQWIAIVLALIFIFSGVRIIQPGEVGVVLRFGKLPAGAPVRPPGLLIAMPYPIDEVIKVSVESIRQIELEDYWQPEVSGTTVASFHPLEQGYCLSGDYNVVLPRLIVKYQVSDAVRYALAVKDPDTILKDCVGTELVRTIGEMAVDHILTEGKAELATTVMMRSQERLDDIGAGIRIVSIEINELIPPRSVLPDFQAVQSAAIEKETAVRNAETYREQGIPQAQAAATQLIAEADAYKVRTVAQANSDVIAFNEILAEYRLNPEVVSERLRNEYIVRALAKVGNRYVAPGPPITGRLLIPPAYGM